MSAAPFEGNKGPVVIRPVFRPHLLIRPKAESMDSGSKKSDDLVEISEQKTPSESGGILTCSSPVSFIGDAPFNIQDESAESMNLGSKKSDDLVEKSEQKIPSENGGILTCSSPVSFVGDVPFNIQDESAESMDSGSKKSDDLVEKSEQKTPSESGGILTCSSPVSFIGDAPFNIQDESGYIHHPISSGSEDVPNCSENSTPVELQIASNETMASMGNRNFGPGPAQTAPCMKPNGTARKRYLLLPFMSGGSSGSEKSSLDTKAEPNIHSKTVKPLTKVGSPASGLSRGLVKRSPPALEKRVMLSSNGATDCASNGRVWNENNTSRFRDNPSINRDFDVSKEFSCGPRTHSLVANIPTRDSEELPFSVRRDRYNQKDFQTDYECAKFYVIKSYNEDNIHRCIKYEVWSSTPNGNKKLDAAFHGAQMKANEMGKRCPVFLFFSVNRSGQFVGLAEMMGKVDFNKDMDFWQLDKWRGFFPVKWHIIKDIPYNKLRHIIIDRNDNRDVTYTKDTQEIGLQEGLEMLSIFKTFGEKTSVLDDFNFYENRERLSVAEKSSRPVTGRMKMYQNDNFPEQLGQRERRIRPEVAIRQKSCDFNPASLLVNRTKKMSLDSCPP